MLALVNSEEVLYLGAKPTLSLSFPKCAKPKCVDPTYRVKLIKLNSKSKAVSTSYSPTKTTSDN
jgi:hypothetical protein